MSINIIDHTYFIYYQEDVWSGYLFQIEAYHAELQLS